MHRLLRQLRLQVTSARTPQRAGHNAGPFGLHPTTPILARMPLLPAEPVEDDAHSVSRDANERNLLREGMFLASRHLGDDHGADDRARHTTRAYELRARWRPTPHAVFAGVALADAVDGPTLLQLGTRHKARSNPSAAWLAATCASLLDDKQAHELLLHLSLTADSTAVRRADRWEAEFTPASSHGIVQRCTVRATAATDLIMATCAEGATTRSVLEVVRSRWPEASEARVLDMITDLVRYGLLIADLLPDDISADPIGRLLTVLSAAHPAHPPLEALRTALAAADTQRPGESERLEMLARARDIADQVSLVDRPLTVDVAADARIDVSTSLVAQAVEAAGVLWLITPHHDPAANFHQRFVERYGHHRYVPLLDAIDPIIGVETQLSGTSGAAELPRRITMLSGLIATATAERVLEVELDEAAVSAMAHQGTTVPPSAEIYVQLIAECGRSAGRGGLRLVVTGFASTASATLARFASLFDHHHTEPDTGRALIAELAVRSHSPSAQTVALPTGFAAHRIPIGVPGRGANDLPLQDLMLVADSTQVLVWSTAHDRQVVPVLYSRLAPHLLPPVARLLHVLGQAGATRCRTWSWDGAVYGPFQPRVRYRNTILSSARWTLPTTLTSAAANASRFNTELDRWRHSSSFPPPPSTVATDDLDRQLPLALDHDADRELLRRYIRRGLTALIEPPGGEHATGAVALGPLGRHLTELVIPLIRRTDRPTEPHRATPLARTHGEGLFHPGGPWLSLAIPTTPHLQDELLLRLADLADGLAEHWDSWFWLRYHTPTLGHHLRARFHGQPEALGGRILPAIANWAAMTNSERVAGRMTVECYEQEIERYGGRAAIEHAERTFAADSRLALTLLPNAVDERISAAAHIAALIARTITDGDLSCLAGRHLNPAARQTMNRLRPQVRAAQAAFADNPGDMDLVSVLGETLTAYRGALPVSRRVACASSLIHMHVNRVLPATGDEPLVRALAADLIARTP